MASDSVARSLALAALQYREEHDKGNYNEIKNKPFINNKMILGSHDANYYDLPMLNETANQIILSMSSEDYLLTAKLLNKDGQVISQDILDMPLEELIIDGKYEEDSEGGWLVLTLRNGNEIRVPLAGLIDELATIEYVDFQDDYLEMKIDSESSRLETLILNEANMRSSEDDWIHELLDDHQVAIDDEIEARELGDSELEAKIDTVKLDLQNLLDSEATLRLVGDSELRDLINSEANTRFEEDQLLYSSIEEEASIRSSEDESIRQFIANNNSEFNARLLDLNNRLNSEGAIRLENDSILSDRIDSEANKLVKEIEDRALGDSEVRQLIVNEANIRYNSDQALSQRINNMSPKVDNITIKKDANNTLSVPIDYDTISVNAQGQLVASGSGGNTTAYLNGHLLNSESNAENVELYWYGTDSEYARLVSEGLINDYTMYIVDDGHKGITEIAYYDELEGLPQINGVTLSGNKSLASFGIQPVLNAANMSGLSVAANVIDLNINPDQFEVDRNNRLNLKTKENFSLYVDWKDGYQGYTINCKKLIDGLFTGYVEFQCQGSKTANTEYVVTNYFGYDGVNFSNFTAMGIDSNGNIVPIKQVAGNITMKPSANISNLGRVGFSFVAFI